MCKNSIFAIPQTFRRRPRRVATARWQFELTLSQWQFNTNEFGICTLSQAEAAHWQPVDDMKSGLRQAASVTVHRVKFQESKQIESGSSERMIITTIL